MRETNFSTSIIFTVFAFFLIVVFWAVIPTEIFASSSEGGGLPYESWLEKIQKSATGPVAYAFALVGIVVAGGVLIFGGDLNGFFRTMLLIVLVMAFLVGANAIMSTLFGTSAIIASGDFLKEIVHSS